MINLEDDDSKAVEILLSYLYAQSTTFLDDLATRQRFRNAVKALVIGDKYMIWELKDWAVAIILEVTRRFIPRWTFLKQPHQTQLVSFAEPIWGCAIDGVEVLKDAFLEEWAKNAEVVVASHAMQALFTTNAEIMLAFMGKLASRVSSGPIIIEETPSP